MDGVRVVAVGGGGGGGRGGEAVERNAGEL